MNTERLAVNIGSVFIFLFLGLYCSRGANLITNGNFEAGNGLPSDWVVTGQREALTYEKTGGKTGEKCIKIESASGETTIRHRELVLSPGQQYKLSGYVKTEKFAGKGGITVVSAGWTWSSKWLKPELPTTDWVYVEEVLTPGPSSNGKYQVVFFVAKDSSGKIWADDIKLEPVETSQADVKK